jgi:hypothetical protein
MKRQSRNLFYNDWVGPNAITRGRLPSDVPVMPSDYKMRLIGRSSYLTIVNTIKVSTWGSVGATHTATQGDNSVRPEWSASVQMPNGENAVYSAGKWMTLGTYINREFIDGSVGQTIVVVGKDWTNDADFVFSKWDPDASNRCWMLKTDQYSVQTNGGASTATEVANFTRPSGSFVLMGRWEPGVRTAAYLNGSTTPYGTPATSPASSSHNGNEPVKIFSNSDSAERLNTGSISELIVWRRPITDAEWQDVNTILQASWLT